MRPKPCCGVRLLSIHGVLGKALSPLSAINKGRGFVRQRSQGKRQKCLRSSDSALGGGGTPRRWLTPTRARACREASAPPSSPASPPPSPSPLPGKACGAALVHPSTSTAGGRGRPGVSRDARGYPRPSPWLRALLGTLAVAFRRACGAARSSRQPSALRQSTLFNLGEGNTSAFPSQHLFSVANPGNTRPFYLLRQE